MARILEDLEEMETESSGKVLLRRLQSPPDPKTKDGGGADILDGKGNWERESELEIEGLYNRG